MKAAHKNNELILENMHNMMGWSEPWSHWWRERCSVLLLNITSSHVPSEALWEVGWRGDTLKGLQMEGTCKPNYTLELIYPGFMCSPNLLLSTCSCVQANGTSVLHRSAESLLGDKSEMNLLCLFKKKTLLNTHPAVLLNHFCPHKVTSWGSSMKHGYNR